MAQMVEAAERVRRKDERSRVREQKLRFLRQPLDARTAGGQAVGLVAGRAEFGPPLDMSAMVADELAPETMLDQPRGAIGALKAKAVGPAKRQRRIAAAIEKEQRLLAFRPRLLDRRDQAR